MKKIILVVLSLIIFLSGCAPKPITEEEKIKAVNKIFFKGSSIMRDGNRLPM